MNVSLSFPVWKLLAGPLVAFITCFCLTPPVRRFAVNVDAIDVPNERRINDHPIPRMGGLAIFCGFVLSVILFVDMDLQVIGLLLGCVTIAVFGALDDILGLNPWIKLGGQFLAAYVALRCGIVFDAISNPGFLDAGTTIQIGWLSVPVTILWIVVSMIVPVSTGSVPLLLACLTGACLGFMPYNMNPAKIFMGDVGSQFLGYVLACVSIMGLFKFHAVITLIVPFLALAIPLFDTVSSFFRRILHGQSPFHADRGHIHHRLLATGMSQKQAVATLYGVSAVLGIIAVMIAGPGTEIRIVCVVTVFVISLAVWFFVFRKKK